MAIPGLLPVGIMAGSALFDALQGSKKQSEQTTRTETNTGFLPAQRDLFSPLSFDLARSLQTSMLPRAQTPFMPLSSELIGNRALAPGGLRLTPSLFGNTRPTFAEADPTIGRDQQRQRLLQEFQAAQGKPKSVAEIFALGFDNPYARHPGNVSRASEKWAAAADGVAKQHVAAFENARRALEDFDLQTSSMSRDYGQRKSDFERRIGEAESAYANSPEALAQIGLNQQIMGRASFQDPEGQWLRQLTSFQDPAGQQLLQRASFGDPEGQYLRELALFMDPEGQRLRSRAMATGDDIMTEFREPISRSLTDLAGRYSSNYARRGMNDPRHSEALVGSTITQAMPQLLDFLSGEQSSRLGAFESARGQRTGMLENAWSDRVGALESAQGQRFGLLEGAQGQRLGQLFSALQLQEEMERNRLADFSGVQRQTEDVSSQRLNDLLKLLSIHPALLGSNTLSTGNQSQNFPSMLSQTVPNLFRFGYQQNTNFYPEEGVFS